jgi:ABC-2 type transport system ATP-binding protein
MDAAIRSEGLSKRFGDVEALADLNLDVAAGEVFGYLGPNGAGKTTTIRLLLGMLHPTSGRAEIFGLDAQHETVAAHRRLAYVGGETNLWPLRDLSVLHHITRAPAEDPRWGMSAVLIGLAVAAATAGAVAFARRDLESA